MKIIKLYESTSLLRKSDPVEQINTELKMQIKEMADLLVDAKGLGLSAPQVGVHKRFFIVMNPAWDTYKVFINPEILSIKGKRVYDDEGCLSIPGAVVSVPRYEKVKVSYFELDGKEHVEEFKGEIARVIQHETDHLNGVLITNYL